MTVYSIYKITNTINNKIYIGYTTQPIEKRWAQHVNNSRYTNTHFSNAIKKYGPSAFRIECLYQSLDKEHTHCVMEPYFIKEYNSYNSTHYNSTAGGDGGPTLPGELNGMYGKTHTDDVKNRLAIAASERFKGKTYESLYGADKALEIKNQKSETLKAHVKNIGGRLGNNNPHAKRVCIKGVQFNTSKEAAKYFNKSQPTISDWLRKYDDCHFI